MWLQTAMVWLLQMISRIRSIVFKRVFFILNVGHGRFFIELVQNVEHPIAAVVGVVHDKLQPWCVSKLDCLAKLALDFAGGLPDKPPGVPSPGLRM